MVKQEAFIRQSGIAWNTRLLPWSTCVLAAGWLCGGLAVALANFRYPTTPYRISAAIILLASGSVQVHVARRLLAAGPKLWMGLCSPEVFVARLLLGVVAAWLCGLGFDNPRGAVWVVLSLVAAWHTWLVVRLRAAPVVAGRSAWRRTRRTVVGLLASVLAVELGMRIFEICSPHVQHGRAAFERLKFEPGTQVRGKQVNALGYWDDEFAPPASTGRLRIAALGSDVILCGTADSNCLAGLERRLPSVDVLNFGIAGGGPAYYLAQWTKDVARQRPDLLLVYVSVGHDLQPPPVLAKPTDWRHLRLLGSQASTSQKAGEEEHSRSPGDYEDYLRLTSKRLAVCRTPIPKEAQAGWARLGRTLEQIAQQCRRQNTTVAVVVVPADFQINRPLAEAARRRAGYEAGQIDLELPQRRVAALSHKQKIPVIDLTPHLRAATTNPYARNVCELNTQGHVVAGRVVGTWLERRYSARLASSADTIRR